jgi:hypothetical protein
LEFSYDALKPWVHYVPVSKSLGEAKEFIEFALAQQNSFSQANTKEVKFTSSLTLALIPFIINMMQMQL